MKPTYLILLSVGVISAQAAFAGNRVQELLAENPKATPYEVLERFYNEAEEPAALTDFDWAGEPTHLKCVYAASNHAEPKDLSHPVMRTLLPTGTVGHGPLFPPTPGKTILMSWKQGARPREIQDRIQVCSATWAAVTTVEASGRDLIQTWDSTGIESNRCIESGAKYVWKFRKSGDLLAIQEIERRTVYGYCYRE